MKLPSLWLGGLAILALILANGFFSAAEIAMISLRRSRIGQLIEEGRRGAHRVAAMREAPSDFLATVQVGITIVGSMASVIGGALAVAVVGPALAAALPAVLRPWSEAVSLGLTVAVISYATLVLGELVPKSLALRYTETLACASAPLIQWFSRLSSPVVRLLSWSTGVLIRPFGGAGVPEAFVSEEEVKHIIREGAHHGIFDEAERELIHSVFEFTDTSVREVIVPRSDIHALAVQQSAREALVDLLASGFSRAPVYDQDLDHIVGVVHVKDLAQRVHKDPGTALAAVMHPAFFIPDSMQISDLLTELQARRVHMAIVMNEFGTVVGLATIEDLLEEIVGEIRDEFDLDEEAPVQELADGSLLVEGSTPLADLQEQYGLPFEETPDYRTLAGWVLARLKRIPKGGEAVEHEGYKLTVVTIDSRRLRKVRIERPGGKRRETGEGGRE